MGSHVKDDGKAPICGSRQGQRSSAPRPLLYAHLDRKRLYISNGIGQCGKATGCCSHNSRCSGLACSLASWRAERPAKKKAPPERGLGLGITKQSALCQLDAALVWRSPKREPARGWPRRALGSSSLSFRTVKNEGSALETHGSAEGVPAALILAANSLQTPPSPPRASRHI